MKDIVYKIRHIPTGLYYKAAKGYSYEKSNFSKSGNIYTKKPKIPTGVQSMSPRLREKFGYCSFQEQRYISTNEDEWEIVEYEIVELVYNV